jgi:transcriptional regulator GlxA family with amidase domain
MLERIQHWRGGRIGSATRRLSQLWIEGAATEGRLSKATDAFIRMALASAPAREPRWLKTVEARMDGEDAPSTVDLAREIDVHPAWLAQAYRAATGEGLQQRMMRRRVERAALLLRHTAEPAAEIAAESGFCDQSHMIRCFRQLLGRTPSEVRYEMTALAG